MTYADDPEAPPREPATGVAAAGAPAVPSAGILFAALGDPTRREIFERVATRPQSVGELAGALPVSRPAVSQHLRVLKEAGLVSDGAAGTRRIYRMNPQGLDHLRTYLDHFWNESLAAFKAAAEQPHKESRR
jgi:DNA-binding transcriptional ArsR family regulator